MSQRPHLEHEGRRYQRQQATWLDGRLIVSRALWHELDTKAKQDPDFWKQCEAQDLEDDPRTRGPVLPGIDLFSEGTKEASNVESQPVRGYQSSPQRHKRDQEHLDFVFKNNGELVLTGDINGGWRRTERSWRFHASRPVPLIKDARVLSCAASVIEDMSGHWHRQTFSNTQTSREAAEDCINIDSVVPHFARLEKTLGPIRCTLDGGTCRFFVKLLDNDRKLSKDLPWQPSGHLHFGFDEYGVYELAVHIRGHSMSEARPFAIKLRCTLQPNELIIR